MAFSQLDLTARVLKPDPRFKTAQTQIKFWKDRYDPGMGGLMNYVMIIPALLFLVPRAGYTKGSPQSLSAVAPLPFRPDDLTPLQTMFVR